jgi:hypothetical protein
VRAGKERVAGGRKSEADPLAPHLRARRERLASVKSCGPSGVPRTCRPITGERTPTLGEQLVELPRPFLVGSRILDLDEKPVSDEDGESLEDTSVGPSSSA